MDVFSNAKNMNQVIAMMENRNGDSLAIKYMKNRKVVHVYSPQLFRDIRKLSTILLRQGLAGKHIGIMGKNSYEWIVAYYAVTNIGSVAVLFNPDFSLAEIAQCAVQTDLDGLIYDPEVEEKVWAAGLSSSLQTFPMSYFQENDLTEPLPEISSQAGWDDVACIIFTSGTTGKSKAVMLANRTLLTVFCTYVYYNNFKAQLDPIPFYHVAGMNIAINAMCLGAVLCIGENPKNIFRYLETMQPDNVFVVPALLNVMEQQLRRAKPGDKPFGGHLKHILCGGAKFPPEVVKTFLDWGITIWQFYGASESGGQGTVCKMNLDNTNALGRIQRKTIQGDIIDGELVLKGNAIMLGYYNDPEETQKVLYDGWYHTGDLCRMGEDGYYYLTGRKNNLIILSNGKNISPEELEGKLRACPQVQEVMVREEKDFLCGEFFPDYPSHCTEEEKNNIQTQIRTFVQKFNRTMPTYKQIALVRFREAPFEKTSVGKLIRK
jgi:long-chain acyl-CoA synthetase